MRSLGNDDADNCGDTKQVNGERMSNYKKRMESFVDSRVSPDERLSTTVAAFKEINDRNNAEAAKDILSQIEGSTDVSEKKIEIMRHAVQRLRSGDLADLAMIGAATVAGLFMGKYSHRAVDLRPSGVPVNGLLGLGAAAGVSVFAMDELPLGARGAVAALGSGFFSGSLMYVNETVDSETIKPVEKK